VLYSSLVWVKLCEAPERFAMDICPVSLFKLQFMFAFFPEAATLRHVKKSVLRAGLSNDLIQSEEESMCNFEPAITAFPRLNSKGQYA
jgi:hypothetical protein